MIKRNLPSNASVVTEGEDKRLIAPAATRNSDVLCTLLAQWAPQSGRALEIASGTGQHVSAFARRLPDMQWQPTELEAERLASIDAYSKDIPNVAPAAKLDATVKGWHQRLPKQNLVVLINLIHLISWAEVETIVIETAKALSAGGRFILYGPFKRDGLLTSEGDERFHEALVQQDAEIGYKNDKDIEDLFAEQGLDIVETVEMPANNLAFVAQK